MARQGQDARGGGTLEMEGTETTIERPVGSVSEVATTVAIRVSDSEPGTVDPSPASFGGDEVERYEKRKSLGEGGMGEVILCKDRWIGREVARKVAHASQGSRPGARSRFLREVRVQGQLEHPGIVPVYDLGQDADGSAYFTMKRIKGLTLEEIVAGLRAGDPEITATHTRRKLMSAMSQVCLTVAFAHSRGVVHRDLKPANVMLGDFGEVYVLDWGVAKVRGSDDDPSLLEPIERAGVGRTEAGALLGTPGYMSPEQVRGEVDSIDARSDVYALGAILFELLALEPLHRSRTLEGLFTSTLSSLVASPAERAPDRDVQPELDAICRTATAASPDDRFQSARELEQAIQSFLDGQRDLERRRELSNTHAQVARQALAEAAEGGADAEPRRNQAMRELGASLALDPSNTEALETMVDVMLQPSDALPPEAEAELESAQFRDRARASKRMMIALIAWYLGTPLILYMGIRNMPLLLGLDALLGTLIVYQWWMSRTGRVQPHYMRWAIPLAFANIASLSVFLGPFVVVPAVATGAAGSLMVGLRANKETRWFIGFCALCAVFIPALLQVVGLLPKSYAFVGDAIHVLPLATGLPPMPTMIFMVLATGLTIVTSATLVGKATETLVDAERRVFGQAYRLRQMLPDGARTASLPPARDDCKPRH